MFVIVVVIVMVIMVIVVVIIIVIIVIVEQHFCHNDCYFHDTATNGSTRNKIEKQ